MRHVNAGSLLDLHLLEANSHDLVTHVTEGRLDAAYIVLAAGFDLSGLQVRRLGEAARGDTATGGSRLGATTTVGATGV